MTNMIEVDGDALVTEPMNLDSTQKMIAYELVKQTALMAAQADQAPRAAMLANWDQAAGGIQAGLGEYLFPICSNFTLPWSTYPNSGGALASYDARFDIMHHGEGELSDGEKLKVVHAQMHHALPFDTQISNYQAFLYAIEGLPAGTYNVTMGFSWGSKVVSGKTYQFTLAQALPAGGQLAGFYGAPDQADSNWRVYAFASQTATTATETVTVAEGSAGTNLGTFTAAGVFVLVSGTPASAQSVTIGGTAYTYYGLNSLHRVAYGNNRWLHSALRQYLNGTGYDWWKPATVFDRPPSYVARQGFMSGLPEEFLAHVRPIARKTAISHLCDGGTAGAPVYDTTYDYFTLPCAKEHNIAWTADFDGAAGLCGEQWEYWMRAAGSSSPAGWWTTRPEYIQYDLAAPTAPRYVWMRSANRGYGDLVAFVNSSGYCYHYAAIYGHRAAPACAIG